MTALAPVSSQIPDVNPYTLLDCRDSRYQHPTHEDVQFLKSHSGMTYQQLGDLLNTSIRQVQCWAATPGTAKATPIPYPAWRLWLIELGLDA